MQVAINGEAVQVASASFATLDELLAHIKEQLPEDQVVSSVQLAGSVVRGVQWQANPASSDGPFEVVTENKAEYLRKRLQSADGYLQQIIQAFAQCVQQYRLEDSSEANTALARAVDDLLAYVQWYLSLLTLDQKRLADHIQSFYAAVDLLQEVCEQLVEPHMYQSNVVVAEQLETRLQPQLLSLQAVCQEAIRSYA